MCVTRGATEKRRDGYITCDALYVAGASLLIFFSPRICVDLWVPLTAAGRGIRTPVPCTPWTAPRLRLRIGYGMFVHNVLSGSAESSSVCALLFQSPDHLHVSRFADYICKKSGFFLTCSSTQNVPF